MGRLRIKIFIIFICCITVLFQQRNAQHLHLYFDPATTPALVQMTHFINLPPNDLKIISWNRFHNHIKNKKQFPNTDFFITDKNNFSNSSLVFQKIEKILQTQQNVHIHLHFNLLHPAVYYFFSTNPLTKNKIKSVHIYEDSSGHIFREKIYNSYLEKIPYETYFYHWGNFNQFCKSGTPLAGCSNFKIIHQKFITKQIDFNKIAGTLSENNKKKIFDLTGFNYEKTKELLKGKKTHFYILGYDWRQTIAGAQLGALKSLCQQNPTKLRERERERERA